jgi:periplasmic divalent cation tolerance protein
VVASGAGRVVTPGMADDRTGMLLVLTTFPDRETAQEVIEVLLGERLAACVSVFPPVESQYVWEGERRCEAEVPVLIKVSAEAYPRLEERLRERHPYAVPEIVAVPVVRGLPAYLAWVAEHSGPRA